MVDLSAIAKWPNVPACYEWLSLDRRGDWRLQGERVTHAGLIAFMNRQYGSDESGQWFVQNGPQRVFVDLALTPWIYRLDGDALVTHTGLPAGVLSAIYLDAEGNLLIEAAPGIGLLDDRDLATVLATCRDEHGQPVDDERFAALLDGATVPIYWRNLPLLPMSTVNLEKRFNFKSQPRP